MDVGDKVRVDGKVGKIVSCYAQGKHTNFCLDDGRALLDLHLRDDVELVGGKKVRTQPVRIEEERQPRVLGEDGNTPEYGEDFQD